MLFKRLCFLSANNPYNEEELLPRIARGDEQAFSRLYHNTNAAIYSAVMAYVKDEHAAHELVQVIYIKVWDHRESLLRVRCLKDYLFILSRNTVFDHLERLTRETKYLIGQNLHRSETDNNVLTHIEERECGHLLHQVISRLPPRQREVYLLADEQEMSYEEIATYMQVSRLTVKRHLELARRFVRKYVHHHLHQQGILPLFFLLQVIQVVCRLLA